MARPTVFITGASRGIGRALALAFGRAGYAVGVNYRQEKAKAEAVVKEVKKQKGAEADVFEGDVRDSLKVRQMIDSFSTKFGTLDVVVNNAGLTRDRTILKMTNGEWNDVIDTNLNGTFWMLREAARVMSKAGRGSIVNIASIMAARPGVGNANYSASKAGIIALTKTAARELGRFDITVNAVMPGFHETEMASGLTPELREKVMKEHALGRTTSLEDLGRLVVELAQNRSISGQVFNVDSRLVG